MAGALPLILQAAPAVAGVAMQAQAQKEAQEEARRQEENARIGGYSDRISSIAEAFGAGAQNKSTAEADALKKILSGF